MPTRQQKFDHIVREMQKANYDTAGDPDGKVYDYWKRRLVDFVWSNLHRIKIASGK